MNGWEGLMVDEKHNKTVINQHQHILHESKVTDVFDQFKIPPEFDLLSLNHDYDNFFLWNGILPMYSPRVVAVKFNGYLNSTVNVVVRPVAPGGKNFTGTKYFGASITSYGLLGRKKGYVLIASDVTGSTLFFLREDIVDCQNLETYTPQELYHPA